MVMMGNHGFLTAADRQRWPSIWPIILREVAELI